MSTIDVDHRPAPDTALVSPAAAPAPAAAAPRTFPPVATYRTDWKAQLRNGAWSILIVAGMLVLVNVMFYHLGGVNTAALESQQVRDLFSRGEGVRRTAVLVLSGFLLLGLVLLRILESHKIHGAAFSLHRRLGQLTQGEYNVFVTLRRGDELQQLAEAINDLVRALRDRTRQNVQILEELGARAEALGPEAQDLVLTLRELLARERALVE